jgi:hypothetical protein
MVGADQRRLKIKWGHFDHFSGDFGLNPLITR